jgi:hypothetical protein
LFAVLREWLLYRWFVKARFIGQPYIATTRRLASGHSSMYRCVSASGGRPGERLHIPQAAPSSLLDHLVGWGPEAIEVR